MVKFIFFFSIIRTAEEPSRVPHLQVYLDKLPFSFLRLSILKFTFSLFQVVTILVTKALPSAFLQLWVFPNGLFIVFESGTNKNINNIGAYNSFVGNVGVQGAYGSTALGLGAALGTYGSYLNEGGGYGGGQSGYGFGGSFYSNKNRR